MISGHFKWAPAGLAAACAIGVVLVAQSGFGSRELRGVLSPALARQTTKEALVASGSSLSSRASSLAQFAALPLHFEPTGAAGAYVSRGRGFALELDAHGATLHLARADGFAALDLQIVGGQPSLPQAEGALPGVSHYLLGSDSSRWRTQVPHFKRVRYESVYPGVDLLYYGSGRELEYDFVVAPGADPSQIQLAYAGVQDIRIDERGDLRVSVDGGEVIHRRPVVYQTLTNGARASVDGAFRLVRRAAQAASTIVAFDIGDYNVGLPLVIDPVLTYATYLGGTGGNEEITTIAVDAAGAVYSAGRTNSTNFPVTAGSADTTHNGGGNDAFVAKLNPQGTALEYATYLGGSGLDHALVLRIDGAGAVYVAGETGSSNFPTSAGAPQTTFGGVSDFFVAKLNATGATLLYSTYLGGSGAEPATDGGGFAVDAVGNAYVYSVTDSTNFPTTPGAPQATRGNPDPAQFDEDVFLTRINAAGTAFDFSTYHGGSGIDAPLDSLSAEARQFIVADNGSAWISGMTESADFPTTAGAFDTTFNGPAGGNPGGGDAFVARFDTDADTRTYSTYLGGTGDELAGPLAVDASGNAYVAIGTESANFPVTAGAFDTGYNGGTADVAVAKLNATGTALVYATYLGGASTEGPAAIRVDGAGAVFVAGSTQSTNFPSNGGADTTHNGGPNDGFITKLNPAGSGLVYSTFAGSGDTDGVSVLEIDSAGSAYAALGDTMGNATVTPGGRAYVGNNDDYFVKLSVAGNAFLDGSYVGGGGDEFGLAMAVDAQQNLYLAGFTDSTDYPTTAGVVQPAKAGAASGEDTFIVKFATTPDSPAPPPGVIALTSSSFDVSESAAAASITVSRSGGSSGTVNVTCTASTEPGFTATVGNDYTATTATLTWTDGDNANKTCSVPIANDTAVEGNETFQIALSNATGGATLGSPSAGTVTIIDNDAPGAQPGVVQFSTATYSGNENGGSVTLTLTRTNGADGAISVSVTSGGGSAAAGTDYTALAQTVSWTDGDTVAKTVSLVIANDAADEPDETVTVTLSNATGGATLGAPSNATVTIVDDDVTALPPPVTQDTTARGSYGGGAFGWYGVLALLLLTLRRRLLVAAMAMTAGTTVANAAELAAGPHIGLRAGIAESTLSAGDISRQLAAAGHDADVSLDDQDRTFSVFGGYRWTNGLGIEASYLDLGEYEVSLTGATPSSAVLPDALAALADAGRGAGLTISWEVPIGGSFTIAPRLGLYYRESERELRTATETVKSKDTGTELTGGISLSCRLGIGWAVGLNWDVYDTGDHHDLRAWTASLEYRFGR